MRLAIQSNDAARVRASLEAHGAKVYFAPERNAVQIIGCNGEVIAHFAVPKVVRDALAD
jgi:hypothetical protein